MEVAGKLAAQVAAHVTCCGGRQCERGEGGSQAGLHHSACVRMCYGGHQHERGRKAEHRRAYVLWLSTRERVVHISPCMHAMVVAKVCESN